MNRRLTHYPAFAPTATTQQLEPVARPEIPSQSVPQVDWNPLSSSSLGGMGGQTIWEPEPFLQQLLQQ